MRGGGGRVFSWCSFVVLLKVTNIVKLCFFYEVMITMWEELSREGVWRHVSVADEEAW